MIVIKENRMKKILAVIAGAALQRVLRTGINLTDGSGFGTLSDGTEIKILLGNMIHYAGAEGYWHKD